MKSILHTKKGFTLLEALVAIAILSVAAGSALTIAYQTLTSAYYANDQTTAFYLAAEAVELVRNVRDNIALENIRAQEEAGMSGGTFTEIDWLQALRSAGYVGSGVAGSCFDINGKAQDIAVTSYTTGAGGDFKQSLDGIIRPCIESKGRVLSIVGGIYTSFETAPDSETKFWRKITINEITPSREAKIDVTVTWKTGPFGERNFTISEVLAKIRP